jgi:hypothetical protein
MWQWVKEKVGESTSLANQIFDRAVKETGAALDSQTANQLKDATKSAVATARKIALHLTDLNGDGKFDGDDLKLAAEKAGIAWDTIDPDLKTALIAGGVAGVGVNIIPFVGQAIAIPAFVGTTAYFYLVAKLRGLGKK